MRAVLLAGVLLAFPVQAEVPCDAYANTSCYHPLVQWFRDGWTDNRTPDPWNEPNYGKVSNDNPAQSVSSITDPSPPDPDPPARCD